MRRGLRKITAFLMTLLFVLHLGPAFTPARSDSEGSGVQEKSGVVQLFSASPVTAAETAKPEASGTAVRGGVIWRLDENAKSWLRDSAYIQRGSEAPVALKTLEDGIEVQRTQSFTLVISYQIPAKDTTGEESSGSFNGFISKDTVRLPVGGISAIGEIKGAEFNDATGKAAGQWIVTAGSYIDIKYYEDYLASVGAYGISTTITIQYTYAAESEESKAIVTSTGMTGGGVNHITVSLTDADNPQKLLDDAVFEIRTTGTNPETLGTMTTGNAGEGLASSCFSDAAETQGETMISLENDIVYELVQVQAPAGYYAGKDSAGRILAEKSAGQFVFTRKGESETDEAFEERVQQYQTAGVTVNEEGAYLISFSAQNRYTATGTLSFSGIKTLTGRGMTEKDVFTFTITENKEVIAEVKNDADGKILFPEMVYTIDGADRTALGNHIYIIQESSANENGITKDKRVYAVIAQVKDNGDGTIGITTLGDDPKALNFTNTYKATGSITFEGTKTMNGRALRNGEFSFQILEGEEVVGTAKNNKEGKIVYPAITYTMTAEDTSALGEHTYRIREVPKEAKNITQDSKEYTVTVTVSDNGDGTLKTEASENATKLDFVNTYSAPKAAKKPTAIVKRRSGSAPAAPLTSDEMTSVTVQIIWDDKDNELGLQPRRLRVYLSDGTTVMLSARNDWVVTIDELPLNDENGELIDYTWTEDEILGYIVKSVETEDDVTIITNTVNREGDPQNPAPHSAWLTKVNVSDAEQRGKSRQVLDDYDTPLGIGAIINHMGDCFE